MTKRMFACLVLCLGMLFGLTGCGEEKPAPASDKPTIGSLPRREKEKIRKISEDQQKKLDEALK